MSCRVNAVDAHADKPTFLWFDAVDDHAMPVYLSESLRFAFKAKGISEKAYRSTPVGNEVSLRRGRQYPRRPAMSRRASLGTQLACS